MSILFVGKAGLGGAQMRGRAVAERMGAHFADWRNVPSGPLDAVVFVKYWDHSKLADVRRRCRLLIHDPLDCFTQLNPTAAPAAFWKWCRKSTACDVMVATSPACAETMEGCGARVVMSPHHADERIGTDWYDPNGPVVYAGGERFLGDERPKIEAACRSLGREFVCRFDKECWQSLKGAALSLCVRFGVERTPLNLACKPTVKLANAARAGIPVLATDDGAHCSLSTWGNMKTDGTDWESDIAAALDSDPVDYPWTLDAHCELLRGIVR